MYLKLLPMNKIIMYVLKFNSLFYVKDKTPKLDPETKT